MWGALHTKDQSSHAKKCPRNSFDYHFTDGCVRVSNDGTHSTIEQTTGNYSSLIEDTILGDTKNKAKMFQPFAAHIIVMLTGQDIENELG